jgi:hypothetical protein
MVGISKGFAFSSASHAVAELVEATSVRGVRPFDRLRDRTLSLRPRD